MKVSPLLQLLHGQSDPFDSFRGIEIDSRANSYIEFACNSLEVVVESWGYRGPRPPSGFAAPEISSDRESTQQYDLLGTKLADSIGDSSLAVAWSHVFAKSALGYAAALLAVETNEAFHLARANDYAEQCLTTLIEKSLVTHAELMPSFNFLIVRYLKMIMALGRYSEAQHWILYLKQQLEEASLTSTRIDRGVTTLLLFQSTGLSLVLWQNPVFTESWTESVYRSDWMLAGLFLPRSTTAVDIGDGAHRMQALEELLATARCLLMQMSQRAIRGITASVGDWYWYISFLQHTQSRLLRFALRLESRLQSDMSDGVTAIAYCLTLGTIYALRHEIQSTSLGHVFMRSTMNILSRLEAPYLHMTTALTGAELLVQSNALLYVAFVAAIAEHRYRTAVPILNHGNPDSCWKARLAELIVLRRLECFEKLEAVLNKFPYTGFKLPLPYVGWLDDAFQISSLFEGIQEPDT
jgi:hypothetical protein